MVFDLGIGQTLLSPVFALFAEVHPFFWIYVPYWIIMLVAFTLSPLTILLPQYLAGKMSWPVTTDFPDEWTIHGKKYNLRPFMKQHPGGEAVLRRCRNSDCTGLFESYHVFIQRETLFGMLARYEIRDACDRAPSAAGTPAPVTDNGSTEISMPPADPFYEDLKQMVRDHFKPRGKWSHKMPWSYKCACFCIWLIMWASIYWTWTHGVSYLVVALIGFCAWELTGNVMHDASHNAFVKSPLVNQILARAAFPFGVNVACWQIQHVMSHHVHTNEEEDVDLHHYEPFLTLPGTRNVNPLVHYFRLTILLSSAIIHLSVAVPYGLLCGQDDALHGHKVYDRVKAIQSHRAELKWEILLEALPLLVFYKVTYSYIGGYAGIAFVFSVYTVASYLFSFFTQVSHLQDDCFLKKAEPSFAKRQVTTSMDFAVESKAWALLSGGLNMQALHHVFPSVSAVYLHELYPKFREVCKKHDVQLKEALTLKSFLWGFASCSS